MAGLWRSGQGTVQHPPPCRHVLPAAAPHLQPDTLRSQIIYPSQATELTDDQLLELLDEVQLGSLAERVGGLNASHDWEKLLSTGEQQRLAFARGLGPHAPHRHPGRGHERAGQRQRGSAV